MPILLSAEQARRLDVLLASLPDTAPAWRLITDPASMPAIAGIGSLRDAGPSEITFLANRRFIDQAGQTSAAALILPEAGWQALQAAGTVPDAVPVLCEAPYLLYAYLAQAFEAAARPGQPAGVHPSAVVAPDVVLGEGVVIGPQVVIESGVEIGARTVIGPGCMIGAGSRIGPDGRLHARVTLYHEVQVGARVILHSGSVLGADGFGFAPTQAGWVKISQLGRVVLGDDVEVGANTTIDRGALSDTTLGDGVKLDNQIMIAHNVVIGEHTAIAACVGIAGSTRIGARCTLGGAAMISGHIELVDDVHISGGTVVSESVKEPGRYTAIFPLSEHATWQRNAAVVHQLSRLRRRLQALERE